MTNNGSRTLPGGRLRRRVKMASVTSWPRGTNSAPVVAQFQKFIDELAQTSTGSANRIARLCLLADPPTIDRGEITDKGSINQRAVLAQRTDTVAALHEDRLHCILKPSAA